LGWDVPGQDKYRENITFQDTRTLEDANVIIFVIDVQDSVERTLIALDYFKRVLQKIEQGSTNRPFISIFIHKMDPDVQNSVYILKNAKRIQDELTNLSTGFNIDFFLTSMFIEPTIFIGFSSVFWKAQSKKKQDELKHVLQFFLDELLLNALIIIDKNNFIITHIEREEKDFVFLQDFVYTLIEAYNNVKEHKLEMDELKLMLKTQYFTLMPIFIGLDEIFIVASSIDPEISLLPAKPDFMLSIEKVIK